MSPIEHYFENLITFGKDIKDEPNKNVLSKEVQEAVEICAAYVKFNSCSDITTMLELEEIKAEISEYGSIWVEYQITGHTDRDIQKIVENVLKQAKEQVLSVIDRHIKEVE